MRAALGSEMDAVSNLGKLGGSSQLRFIFQGLSPHCFLSANCFFILSSLLLLQVLLSGDLLFQSIVLALPLKLILVLLELLLFLRLGFQRLPLLLALLRSFSR